ncbi:hypothetical protein O181_125247, partial [Austropuccinia psidii MF-1]|nr:hypothetical protein [Austropuccinia psidii MF-1]
MAKRNTQPQLGQEPQVGHNQPWAPFSTHRLWQPPGATSSGPEQLPLSSGEDFPSFMDRVPKDPGGVHI